MKWVERSLIALLCFPVIGLLWQSLGGLSGQPLKSAWDFLRAEPAMVQSIVLTLAIACTSVLLALWISCWLTFRALRRSPSVRFQSLILAIPHSAMALGALLFLGASGVVVRWGLSLSPEFGLPDYLFPRDRFGLGVLAVLVVKESVFLTLLAIPLAGRLPLDATWRLADEMGFNGWQGWRMLIWPQLRRLMRAPILVVFAFSLANIEVAMILGSDQVPFFAVHMLRWLTDPDPVSQQAGAMAVLGLLSVLLLLSFAWVSMDRRLVPDVQTPINTQGMPQALFSSLGAVLVLGCMASLFLWSIAGSWSVRDAWPSVTTTSLSRVALSAEVWLTTAGLGLVVATLAVVLAVIWLECMTRHRQTRLSWVWWGFLWLPSLPMSAGLLGWLYVFGIDPGFGAVVFGHLLVALPYVLVVLSDAWLRRSESERVLVVESGLSVAQAMWRLWIPKHSLSLLVAFAVAFSVSLSLYTQTLLLGGGRVETLITELVVNLSGDRRSAAAYGLWNTVLPWMMFIGVALCGRLLWRHRIGMRGYAHA